MSDNPDAKLIRLCEEHIANLKAYNTRGGNLKMEDDPLWHAYERTRDAIDDAEPQTLVGMQAKARAAKAEARNSDGTEDPENCPAANWSWDLLHDLFRVTGVAP